MSDTQESGKGSERANRLLKILRERVDQRERAEVLECLDELVPRYVLPQSEDMAVDNKMDYRLAELLGFHEEAFVRNIYRCILKRKVEFAGLQDGMDALQVEGCSRVELIGRLRYSEEGEQHGVHIRGLRQAFILERLKKVAIAGRVISILSNVRALWALPSEIQWIEQQLHEADAQLASTEDAVLHHLGSSVQRLDGLLQSSIPQGSEDTVRPNDAVPAGDQPVSLSEVLRLSGKEFVQFAYQRVLSRSPDANELAEALFSLGEGTTSKIEIMGTLARNNQRPVNELNVVGLAAAYRKARLERIPVLGLAFKLSRCITTFTRLDAILEYHGAQIARNSGHIVTAQTRLMRHYNSTVAQVRREVVDALRSDGNSKNL